MTDELDTAVRGALTAAAREAPAVPAGLLERVEAGHRRRRRRRTGAAALATALAVAVVVGGTGVVGGLPRPDDRPPPAAAAGRLEPVPRAALGTPVKVRDKWPDAVRRVPGRLPNGRELYPVELLDGDRLVGVTWSSLQRPDKLWSYAFGAGEARVITDIVVPRGSKVFASDFAIGGGQVVWWLSYRVHGRDTVEIWGAPIAGGAAHKITGMRGSGLSALLIDDDTIVWAMSTGVYEMPLSGGVPAKIPGTDGFGIVFWPWIGSPVFSGNERVGIGYRSLWNVRTGERRKTLLAPFNGPWSCRVTWCVASSPDVGTAVQRRDGKAGRLLSGNQLMGWMPGVVYGRFLAYNPEGPATKTYLLYDVEAGRLLDTGIRQQGEVMGPGRNDRNPQHFFERKDGTTLIDLSKIR